MSHILFSNQITEDHDHFQVFFQPYFLSLVVYTARAAACSVREEQHHLKKTSYSSEWIQ